MDRSLLERLRSELDVERDYLALLQYGVLFGFGGLLIRRFGGVHGVTAGLAGPGLVVGGIALVLIGAVHYERRRRVQAQSAGMPLPRVATGGVAVLIAAGLVLALLAG